MMFDLKDYLLSLPDVICQSLDKQTDIYLIGSKPEPGQTEGLFAVVNRHYKIDQLMLKSEAELANVLREKYESVSASKTLNPNIWSTFILSGQLTDQEIIDLIDHSYRLTRRGFNG